MGICPGSYQLGNTAQSGMHSKARAGDERAVVAARPADRSPNAPPGRGKRAATGRFALDPVNGKAPTFSQPGDWALWTHSRKQQVEQPDVVVQRLSRQGEKHIV